jgi:hypothetical protein
MILSATSFSLPLMSLRDKTVSSKDNLLVHLSQPDSPTSNNKFEQTLKAPCNKSTENTRITRISQSAARSIKMVDFVALTELQNHKVPAVHLQKWREKNLYFYSPCSQKSRSLGYESN